MKIDVQLTDDEYTTMILMCGYATGAAMKQGDKRLADSFILITNRLHEGNPNFRPYEVGEKNRESER
jgi:hypothetical protein